MREFGSVPAALEALPEIASQAGVKSYEVCPISVVEREYRAGLTKGAHPVFFGAPEYPKGLLDLPDPPAFLWALGRTALVDCTSVALVGARNASVAGRNMTKRLARELGEAGYAVISGLARGIDKAAHEASLESGTIAVLAGGVDVDYPKECAELAASVRDKGLCLSENPIGLQPQARHFPQRNRIISGIAAAVVVVEGATKSGSLITARNALDQGREVMAVPGSPLDARAGGCNILIRDGAVLVRSAADIIDCLSADKPNKPDLAASPNSSKSREGDVQRAEVLNALGPTPIREDTLIAELGAETHRLMALLAELEVEGLIERQPGGTVARLTEPAT